MSSLSASQVRLDYLKAFTQRLLAAARVPRALVPPEVEGVIADTEGTLHKNMLGKPLKVTVPIWGPLPDPIDGDKDLVKLQMAEVDASGAVGEFKDIGTSQEFDNTYTEDHVEFDVAVADYPANGKRQLRYVVKYYNISLPQPSDPTDLIFDSTPPWGNVNPPQAITPTIPNNVITDAFFTAHPTGLEVTLEPYDNQLPKDIYALYFTDTPPLNGKLPNPVESGLVPVDRKLLIPKAKIEALGDGIYYLTYILIDPATHISRIALPIEITVNLGELPTNLQEPKVPLAADGKIDLDDARLGVDMEIAYDNHRFDDTAEITWGNAEPFAVQIGTSVMPRPIRIPYATLRAAYDFNTAPPQETPVSYRILRHKAPYGNASDNVDVDFSTAVTDPDPSQPGPINPALRAPMLQGAVTPEPNKLREVDKAQPVKLSWDLHTGAKDNQRVRFSWGGILVSDPADGSKPLEVAIDTTVDPLTVDIPWEAVEKAGNDPQTEVYCIFLKESGDDNQQHSISQLVDVDAIPIEPEAAVFERSVGGNGRILGCESLWEDPENPAGEPAFLVTVHGLSEYLPAGGKINMKWTALKGTESSGGGEIPGTKLEQNDIEFTEQEAKDGFQWEIKPYDKHILPIYSTTDPEGRGRVEYSFKLNDDDDDPVPSKTAQIRVALFFPGSGTCPIPPVTP